MVATFRRDTGVSQSAVADGGLCDGFHATRVLCAMSSFAPMQKGGCKARIRPLLRSGTVTHSVLIVDDSRVSRMMIKARMQAVHPDWTYLEAGSGDEALTMVAAGAPDYLTMDMNMPGLTGFEAAEQIRAIAPSVCMVMLTANIQESSRTKADVMNLHFVQKPITDASIKLVLDHFKAAT